MRFPSLAADRNAPRSIRYRLIALSVSILLPMLGLFSWQAVVAGVASKHIIELKRASVARAISSRTDQELSEHIGALKTLSMLSSLSNGKFDNFQNAASAVSRQAQIVEV